jgi:hypothetical protein
MNAADPRFDEPDLDAKALGKLMGLTERQVKDRVTKEIFKCHWRGNHRGMRFTPEDVTYNRSLGASVPAVAVRAPSMSPQVYKGVARLRKAQKASTS